VDECKPLARGAAQDQPVGQAGQRPPRAPAAAAADVDSDSDGDGDGEDGADETDDDEYGVLFSGSHSKVGDALRASFEDTGDAVAGSDDAEAGLRDGSGRRAPRQSKTEWVMERLTQQDSGDEAEDEPEIIEAPDDDAGMDGGINDEQPPAPAPEADENDPHRLNVGLPPDIKYRYAGKFRADRHTSVPASMDKRRRVPVERSSILLPKEWPDPHRTQHRGPAYAEYLRDLFTGGVEVNHNWTGVLDGYHEEHAEMEQTPR